MLCCWSVVTRLGAETVVDGAVAPITVVLTPGHPVVPAHNAIRHTVAQTRRSGLRGSRRWRCGRRGGAGSSSCCCCFGLVHGEERGVRTFAGFRGAVVLVTFLGTPV